MPPKRAAPPAARTAKKAKPAPAKTAPAKKTPAKKAPAKAAAGKTALEKTVPARIGPAELRDELFASLIEGKKKARGWSRVSASANLVADYNLKVKDKEKAYAFVCMCKSPFEDPEDEGEDEDEDDEVSEDESGKSKPSCDDGKNCVCKKPADEHPDNVWFISNAGMIKYHLTHSHIGLRNPDIFHMYTFNDHAGYGGIQTWENMILDYELASIMQNWQEQWAVCEAFTMILPVIMDGPTCCVDDSKCVKDLLLLTGTMFLDMLFVLEKQGKLRPDSDVKNLATVMAAFAAIPSTMSGTIDRDAKKAKAPEPANKFDGDRKLAWDQTYFEQYIVAYATRHGITLHGPSDIDEIVAASEITDVDAELPLDGTPASPATDEDATFTHNEVLAKVTEMMRMLETPWGFLKALRKYEAKHAGLFARTPAQRKSIGGDSLDITTWSSTDRKQAAFDGKDPFPPADLKKLKEGMVLCI